MAVGDVIWAFRHGHRLTYAAPRCKLETYRINIEVDTLDSIMRNTYGLQPEKLQARQCASRVQRGQAAAKAMAKELSADHKRWILPLLSWKDGKVVTSKP